MTVTCARCDQRRAVQRPKLAEFSAHARGGCAGRRFRGRYRYGDWVDAENTWCLFEYYAPGSRMRATVRAVGWPGAPIEVEVAALRPVFAGRAEADKRLARCA